MLSPQGDGLRRRERRIHGRRDGEQPQLSPRTKLMPKKTEKLFLKDIVTLPLPSLAEQPLCRCLALQGAV